jgi:hypothetical protein
MFADDDRDEIKLIDFGYARKYMVNGEHAEPGHYPPSAGSKTILSISALDLHFPSRKDDMFRFGEELLKLLSSGYNRLFGPRVTVDDIRKIKLTTIPKQCCRGATLVLESHFELVHALGYTDKPDYDALRGVFLDQA